MIGNLHINVVADAYSQEIEDTLEPFIFEVVRKYNFISSICVF